LVTIWGLRLSFHIFTRNKGKPEDFRYAKWRQDIGLHWWWISYFQVFLLQGFLMWIVSLPLQGALSYSNSTTITWLDALGVLIWLTGFLFESIGDCQLAKFKSDPSNKGKLLSTGLWRYSRHPNYFGDAAQWWGFYLFALAAGAWWTIISPILMTFLLLRVSGVILLEKTLSARTGYEDYMKSTSSFFPFPPNKNR
jgi:steroid 5-alpha reductase family enzyme